MRQVRNEAFFNHQKIPEQSNNSINKCFTDARRSGNLNLNGKGLVCIPPFVFNDIDAGSDAGEVKFWELNPIQKVDLSFNSIEIIPSEIGNLRELQKVVIRSNKIRNLPSSLFSCDRLLYVDISINPISNIDGIENCRELREINFNACAFTQFPLKLCWCSDLTVIQASENNLMSLPLEFSRLKKLKSLNLSKNSLTVIPSSVFQEMNMINTIDLRKNKLKDSPDLSYCSSLTFLDMTENCLEVPPVLPVDGHLKVLCLGSNKISNFTLDHIKISAMVSLTELHLHTNSISAIPSDIARLKFLKVLDFSNNEISDVPFELGYIASLDRLLIDGNPIRTIRRSLIGQSTADLKTFLRSRGAMPPYINADSEYNSGGPPEDALKSQIQERAREATDVLDLSGKTRYVVSRSINCTLI